MMVRNKHFTMSGIRRKIGTAPARFPWREKENIAVIPAALLPVPPSARPRFAPLDGHTPCVANSGRAAGDSGRLSSTLCYRTAVIRLLGRLSPALLMPITWYSISTPSGWSVRTVIDSKHNTASFHSVWPAGRVITR